MPRPWQLGNTPDPNNKWGAADLQEHDKKMERLAASGSQEAQYYTNSSTFQYPTIPASQYQPPNSEGIKVGDSATTFSSKRNYGQVEADKPRPNPQSKIPATFASQSTSSPNSSCYTQPRYVAPEEDLKAGDSAVGTTFRRKDA